MFLFPGELYVIEHIVDTNLNTDEKPARIKKVYEETDKLVKLIPTPVQWKQWEQHRKNELSNIK